MFLTAKGTHSINQVAFQLHPKQPILLFLYCNFCTTNIWGHVMNNWGHVMNNWGHVMNNWGPVLGTLSLT